MIRPINDEPSSFETHIVSSSLLLIEFEHVGAQTEFAEEAVTELF